VTSKWDWGRRQDLEAAPPGIDISKPSQARIYDVLLGGKDNFASDRAAAELIVAGAPDAPAAARENRAFLGRAVRHCGQVAKEGWKETGTGLHFRDLATVEHYFDGFELVEPGVVWVPEWQPGRRRRGGLRTPMGVCRSRPEALKPSSPRPGAAQPLRPARPLVPRPLLSSGRVRKGLAVLWAWAREAVRDSAESRGLRCGIGGRA
jgi:S-adenosyl methyltransferase